MLPITLNGHNGHPIHDVSWAPNMGRSYHLIASACKDGTARIWTINNKTTSSENTTLVGSNTPKKTVAPQQVTCKVIDDHHAEVWRVEWNMIGTVLATSGDDGTVRVWKYKIGTKEWVCEAILRNETLQQLKTTINSM